jgi:anti-sigma factor RsiW
MKCETARRLLENDDPALAAHMRSCPLCVIGARARYYEAPPGLEQRIRRSLLQERTAPAAWRWLAVAASLLLCVSVAWNISHFRTSRSGQLVAENVISAHIRSLAGTHLLDVPSTDQHTVKPWFNGKLDFSPPVKEVAGFELRGGRLEYFAGHPAAALVYSRGNHIINLFAWTAAEASRAGSQTSNGYHVEHWWSGGMVFWAISDLNPAELSQFVAGFQRN